MDRTERFYRIDQLLNDRSVVPLELFLDELGVSRATFKRDLEYLRDRLNAPIEWDRDAGGYRYAKQPATGPSYALPGLWFSGSEAHALLTMQHLLANLDPGLLKGHIEPLQARLRSLLGSRQHDIAQVEQRIRIQHAGKRRIDSQCFATIASATLSRRQLQISHYRRQSGEHIERTVSPQRLTFYRDNWYLDAWCHLRHGIRSFAVDAIAAANMLGSPAQDIDSAELDRVLAAGYGIFSGSEIHWASLKFSPLMARWVSHEIWHPQQRSEYDADGHYLLHLPYSDDRELLMDILKYGSAVEVLAPPGLRQKTRDQLRASLAPYAGD